MVGAGVAALLLSPVSPGATRRSGSSTSAATSTREATSTASAAVAPLTRQGAGPAGLSWLVRACRASSTVPFSGVQRVRVHRVGGDRTSMVDVAHVPGSGVRLTVRGDGTRPTTTFVGQSAGPSLLPSLDEAALARISSRYRATAPMAGVAVAGRATEVVELRRTTGPAVGSVAARFWLDRQTFLPLQREVLDGAGRVQQVSSYISITYRRPVPSGRIATVVGTSTDGGRGVTAAQLDGFRHSGWVAPGQLPEGFDLVDARMRGTGSALGQTPPLVLQLAYTDGISVVSLFEQRGRLDPGPLTGWDRQRRGHGVVYADRGTPRRMIWSADGRVFTLISDDPGVADSVTTALPRPSAPPGVAARLRHGLDRLVSWFDPFG
jgi:sigma-E factor negative regulatory protein RseB